MTDALKITLVLAVAIAALFVWVIVDANQPPAAATPGWEQSIPERSTLPETVTYA